MTTKLKHQENAREIPVLTLREAYVREYCSQPGNRYKKPTLRELELHDTSLFQAVAEKIRKGEYRVRDQEKIPAPYLSIDSIARKFRKVYFRHGQYLEHSHIPGEFNPHTPQARD